LSCIRACMGASIPEQSVPTRSSLGILYYKLFLLTYNLLFLYTP
jgi:hypothetical protein